ncbi:MAG: hypothetical protein JNJ56_11370 [Ignavibacteria bacterium]|nr:hypothetical protein [Ignavibacteria bacterium]
MEKIISIVKKSEQENIDREYWNNATIEERFMEFKIIFNNYIALCYGTDPGFQRVLRIVKQERS